MYCLRSRVTVCKELAMDRPNCKRTQSRKRRRDTLDIENVCLLEKGYL